MKEALILGPISVAVTAKSHAFKFYKTGILGKKKCDGKIDHGLLAVGWGKLDGTGEEYFLVKNQWGTAWGENGYAKIGINNACKILERGSYPIV